MANAWCINAYNCDWCLIQTLWTLDSANIWVWVQVCVPDPLDDKRLDYIKYTDKCWNTCCLTWENEILIYATQWVIKNFTLTNDDANEVVNVKRNDIFWSNWKKTVVRYKIWSFPTSITDWTLAVEETTMNQYSSTWYNVSWLSDWTTYYFSAFAVAQDDTIIVVQTNSITPEFLKLYEYSYNFVNSSIAQMTADWRSWMSGASFSNKWISCSWRHTYKVIPTWLSSAMSNCKKLTIVYNMNKPQNSTQWDHWVQTTNQQYSSWIYCNSEYVSFSWWWTRFFESHNMSIPTWDHTLTCIFDLINKTAYFTFPWVKTSTYSLSDSNIADIKTDNGVIISQSTYSYIKDFLISVEY